MVGQLAADLGLPRAEDAKGCLVAELADAEHVAAVVVVAGPVHVQELVHLRRGIVPSVVWVKKKLGIENDFAQDYIELLSTFRDGDDDLYSVGKLLRQPS